MIYVADSLNLSMSYELIRALINLWVPIAGRVRCTELSIRRLSVQHQGNSYDCGAFALAFMYASAKMGDLEALGFKQGEMRAHLYSCFKSGAISDFPHADPVFPSPENLDLKIMLRCKCGKANKGADYLICVAQCFSAYHSCIETGISPFVCTNCKNSLLFEYGNYSNVTESRKKKSKKQIVSLL